MIVLDLDHPVGFGFGFGLGSSFRCCMHYVGFVAQCAHLDIVSKVYGMNAKL